MSHKYASLQPGCYKKPPFSVEVPGYEPVEGETIPRRNPKYATKLVSRPEEGVTTVFDILMRTSERFGDLKGIGTRKHIKTHNEVKKTVKIVDGEEIEVSKNWTFFEYGEYEYITFGQYVANALQIGSGLRNLGLTKEDRLHIFASTSANWLLASHAAVTQSMPIVTSYATLGEEGLEVSLTQTQAKAIFVDSDLIPKLFNPLKKATHLEILVYNNGIEANQANIERLRELYPAIKIFSLNEIQLLGERSPVEPVPPKPDDICCLMYTSGTTGTPKGVPLRHRNIIAAVAGLDSVFHPYLSPSDGVLCYLPLAHSFEFAFENACLFWGLKMGYGSPRTLSDTNMRNCKGDIKEFRPTILIGVPAIWETIRKGIEQKVSQLGYVKRNLFWAAMIVKIFLCKFGFPGSGLLDTLVFNNIKRETGGRLRACFNGAGPIGRETRRFISFAIVPLLMGYGLTETMAMGALMDPLEWNDYTLGDIPGSIEIKLVDYADAGYFTTSNPPQGEILIRGEPVMNGYYENDEETAEALTIDGWFRTGDIGEWSPNGHLTVIDRKKNLVKTLNGEYIALEKLESIYRTNNIISNICIYAAPDRAKPIAIVFPAFKALQTLADSKSIEHTDLKSLVQNHVIKAFLLKELQATARKAGLAPFEVVEGVVLTDFEWTNMNGLLTPAQKLSRRNIVKLYQKEIDVAYGRTKSVL
ncbi:long-chain-fatty-acid-CoA ligase-like protein [Tricladium varicosporioides]|nr:long-chain-fatty-acid-CoA ligase-like protein [Hymenoscyphus varicosporioides]